MFFFWHCDLNSSGWPRYTDDADILRLTQRYKALRLIVADVEPCDTVGLSHPELLTIRWNDLSDDELSGR